ncbi:substrate-binding periplasmic protein [Pseudoduganella sp. OTU4001]|uniref:substrate-binding periplasmic protein n=1 Tax=Pseudoduganella sp. OTU4001 TaxID=3043854 RepID=UPI00313ABD8C
MRKNRLLRRFAFSLALCCATPSLSAQNMPLRVALSDAMPPMSHMENGEAQGMFREVLESLIQMTPGYRTEFHAFPWARAQWLVQNEQMDIFLTFPSRDRRKYAHFTRQAVFTMDYGNLVYRIGNPNTEKILAARSFEDLRGLVFISQDMVQWEKENVPSYIPRYTVYNPTAIMHMAFQRKTGDFFIMPVEQAIHYARMQGYSDQMAMRQVSFIPNSQVPFHIGVRKSLEGSRKLVAAIETAMQSPAFRARLRAIQQKYRGMTISEAGGAAAHAK